MGTPTLRNDIATGLKTLVDNFVTANPGSFNVCLRSRPKSMGDRPLAYVGTRSEDINHTGTSLYQRDPQPNIVFVWGGSNVGELEFADVRDDLIDAFIAYSMTLPHAVSNDTTCSAIRVEDVEIAMDEANYPASIITFQVYSLGGAT